MPENIYQVLIPVVILLFVIWLIYRMENRLKPIVKDAVYNSFPFFKKAADNFQYKIDYLNNRVEALEDRINKLENKTRQ